MINKPEKENSVAVERKQTSKPALFDYEQVKKTNKRFRLLFVLFAIFAVIIVSAVGPSLYKMLSDQYSEAGKLVDEFQNSQQTSTNLNFSIPESENLNNKFTDRDLQSLIEQAEYSKASSLAEQKLLSTQTEKQQIETYYWLGVAKYNLGNYSEAEKAFLEILNINPDHPEANFFVAELKWLQGNSAGCLTYAEKAVESNPENDASYSLLGTCLLNSGDRDGAIAAFKKAVEFNPENQNHQRTLKAITGQ